MDSRRAAVRARGGGTSSTARATCATSGCATIASASSRITDCLLDHPCVDCGETDVRVLDFDHEDRTTKLTEIGRLVGTAMPWGKVLEEIAKCSVRCANCHRRRTAEQLGSWRHEAEMARRQAVSSAAADRLASLATDRPAG